MIRHLAKWYISRAIDLEKPVPVWVRLWMQRDPELQRFAKRSGELKIRLQADAGEWSRENKPSGDLIVSATPPRVSLGTIGSRSTLRNYIGQGSLATAAILVVVIGLVWQPWSNEPPRTPGVSNIASVENANSANPAVREDTKAKLRSELLAATINSSAHVIQKFSLQQLRPEIERSGLANIISTKNVTKSWPFPTSIESSTDVAAITTSKFLLSLNDGMQAEQLQLLDDLKQAADYFSRKLPQRAMTLVGIDVR